ncbi:MAG: carbon-phosphorus lyase subunit PhnH, partial [Mesorhizobium sp.]
LWFDLVLQAPAAVKSWLGFHTGAPLANTPADAHFALIATPAEMMALDGFSQGTQDYPDRSTTLILQVSDLVSGAPLLLEGPGIEKTAT